MIDDLPEMMVYLVNQRWKKIDDDHDRNTGSLCDFQQLEDNWNGKQDTAGGAPISKPQRRIE